MMYYIIFWNERKILYENVFIFILIYYISFLKTKHQSKTKTSLFHRKMLQIHAAFIAIVFMKKNPTNSFNIYTSFIKIYLTYEMNTDV